MNQRQNSATEPLSRMRSSRAPVPHSEFRITPVPPRAQTPVPELKPASTKAAPADNSLPYENRRRIAASARTNAQPHDSVFRFRIALTAAGGNRDLTGSNKRRPRCPRRVSADKRPQAALFSHCRRLARLRFMAWQVVLFPAAARGSGHRPLTSPETRRSAPSPRPYSRRRGRASVCPGRGGTRSSAAWRTA